ncbi:unnamed protein product [Taenia asiatica]|uniref:FBD domain-containing protein n=1 Tax=Taenia asiatica TaxID=60517 RepID=A0A0R3VV07_TAEAS|nr:unnamed protein product [Taenia asiatica]
MSFLEVDYTESSLSVCGPQDIISRLNLPKHISGVRPFNDFTKVVITKCSSTVPLDVIFLAVYSRASSLSGTIVEQSKSPASRHILWSFPIKKNPLVELWNSMDLPTAAKALVLTYVLRTFSLHLLNLNVLLLFFLSLLLLYLRRLFH